MVRSHVAEPSHSNAAEAQLAEHRSPKPADGSSNLSRRANNHAAVAQVVERRFEEPGVEGSSPSRCTNFPNIKCFQRFRSMAGCPRKAPSNECLADVPCESQSQGLSASRGSMTPETRIWPRAESLDCRDRDPPGGQQRCGPPPQLHCTAPIGTARRNAGWQPAEALACTAHHLAKCSSCIRSSVGPADGSACQSTWVWP